MQSVVLRRYNFKGIGEGEGGGQWSSSRVKEYLEEVGRGLSYRTPEDWYQISLKEVDPSLLHHYEAYTLGRRISLSKALSEVYPHHSWQSWRFVNVPNGLWNDAHYQKEFISCVGAQLGLTDWHEWHQVTTAEFKRRGGAGLLKQYSGSLITALTVLFPQYNWSTQRAIHPFKYWHDIDNQRQFMNSIAKELQLHKPEDWYNVSCSDIIRRGGASLLRCYGNSLTKGSNVTNSIHMSALNAIYPEFEWESKKRVPPGYWSDLQNQREILDNIAKRLGIREHSDWYTMRTSDMSKLGIGGLLHKYKGSLLRALSTVYPNYDWKPWTFAKMHQQSQHSMNDQEFLRSLQKNFGLKAKSRNVAMEYAAGEEYSLITRILNEEKNTLPSRRTSKRQLQLYKIVQQLFPQRTAHLNYRHNDLLFKTTFRGFELDIFLPDVSLAIEYQGEQHYHPTRLHSLSLKNQQERDAEKRRICKSYGISLLEIPYSWNGSMHSLRTSLKLSRPDLFPDAITAGQTALPLPRDMTFETDVQEYTPILDIPLLEIHHHS